MSCCVVTAAHQLHNAGETYTLRNQTLLHNEPLCTRGESVIFHNRSTLCCSPSQTWYLVHCYLCSLPLVKNADSYLDAPRPSM